MMNSKTSTTKTNMNVIDNDFKKFGSENNDPRPPIRYEIIKRRDSIVDVKLLFGKWNGFKISEMWDDPDGRNYIRRFLMDHKNNFPKDFEEAVEEVIEGLDDDEQ